MTSRKWKDGKALHGEPAEHHGMLVGVFAAYLFILAFQWIN